MADLSVNYLGLRLKSPVIVGACDLLENISNIKKIEAAGAGAIVYKSLFEEQIQLEDLDLHNHLTEYSDRNAEMTKIFPDVQHAGPSEYLYQLKKIKASVEIPVFASLNAIYKETWLKYAKQIAETGVDGLELNFYNVPFSFDKTAEEIENEQVEIIKSICFALSIPVSVKLSRYYTNPLLMAKKAAAAGAKGIVIFNKMFQPDIDLHAQKHITPWNLSSPDEYRLALRYSGLMFGELETDIIASSGVYNGEDVIRLLLAGSSSVQVVSTLYKNGVVRISEMLLDLQSWMQKMNYSTIDEFRGKLSRKNTKNPFVYKRAQYIDAMLKSEALFGRPVL